eukprot:gnl/TRDRNA2_/TRDRNA2_178766_c0_seq1.p1 gnl/TRDRNA2_/TRDRNA2_178766_c0~~gnl/TRDRNA2_/TRDRNA2_178766_c0_seq1.p1  ORF type:complete len:504 (+),score=126.55 gnl/TRDRNA2_/TRDRNA2_178766_c0_seq1:96-1514(+)
MCPPGDSAVSASTSLLPSWRLEERDSTWRLAVAVTTFPEIELSDKALRLQLKPDAMPVTIAVPEEAQPIDPEAARCSFSKKRGELSVQWPMNLARAAPAAHDDSQSDVPRGENEKVEEAPVAPKEETTEKVANEEAEEVARMKEAATQAAEVAKVAEMLAEATEADEQATEVEVSAAVTHSGAEPSGEAAETPRAVDASSAAVAEMESEVAACEEVVSPEEWKARGNAAVKAENLEEAVRCYSAGIANAAGDVEAVLRSNRSLCFHKLARYEEALEDAKRCTVLKQDFFKGYLRGAMALRALGRAEEAFAFVKRCPRHDEAEALAAELRPEAEAAENVRIAALGGADKAKEQGNQLFRKGLFEPALEKYTEALELCEDQEGDLALAIRNNRAACNHQLSNFKAVVSDASFVLERDPQNFKALVRRMLALEPLERYEAALQDVRAVLRQNPRHEAANRLQHSLGKIVRELHRN